MSGSLERDIAELAENAGVSRSEYARRVLKQHVTEQYAEDINREARAEERIEAIVERGKDEIRAELEEFTRTARMIQELTARAGVYSIANFELDKRDHKDAYRREALSTGARRLHGDLLDGVDLDLDVDAEDLAEGAQFPWETDNE